MRARSCCDAFSVDIAAGLCCRRLNRDSSMSPLTTSLVREVDVTAGAPREDQAARPSPTKQWVFQGLFDEHAPRRAEHVVMRVASQMVIGRRGGSPGRPGPRLELDDPHVSGEHARVTPIAEGLWFEDLQSRNGIWFNGSRVSECTVRPGDLLRIGRSLVTCGSESDIAAAMSADGLLGGSNFREVREELEACSQSTQHVVVVGGPGSGKRAFARALAQRQGRACIEFDPTRVPPRLLEVELFGNQRVRGALRSAGEGALYLTRPHKLNAGQLRRLTDDAKALGTRLMFGVAEGSPLLADPSLSQASRVSLPALERRRGDIPSLISSVVPRGLIGIQVEFVEACYFETWPGNIGQLLRSVRDAVARAVAERESAVGPRHLQKAEPGGTS